MEERRYYHYTFTTYNRKHILGDKEVNNNIHKWFHEIAKEKQFDIISLNILADHVHILIEQKLNDSPSYIMKCIKGASSHKLFKYYTNTNRYLYRKLWSRSYHCREITPNEIKEVINYIKNQTSSLGADKRYIAGVKKEPRRSASGSKSL